MKGLSLALVIIFNLPSVKSGLFAGGEEGFGEETFWKNYVTPGVLTLVALTIAFITGGTAKESFDLFKNWNRKRKRQKALGLAAVAVKDGVRQLKRRSPPQQVARRSICPRPDAAGPLSWNEGGRLDEGRAESDSASVDAAEAVAAGVGTLDPEDRVPLSHMQGAAARQELAAEIKSIKLSLIEKVNRDEIHSIVDGAIRSRESALAGRLLVAHGQALPDQGTHSLLLPEPAALQLNWDEGTRLATVFLGAHTDSRPLPMPSVPASVPASNPTTSSEMTIADEDAESCFSESTGMVWM